jgi:hypothetical protein
MRAAVFLWSAGFRMLFSFLCLGRARDFFVPFVRDMKR